MFANQATMAIVAAGQLEELRALAEEDPLTGLPNRRAFMRDLESELERTRRHGRPLALVLCDVDDLKHINDTQGHPGGDRALCAVGRACATACEPATPPSASAVTSSRCCCPRPPRAGGDRRGPDRGAARTEPRPAAELRNRRGA